MKKAILQEFVSLDGLAAGPNDSVDFVPASMQGDQRFGQRQMEFLDSIDTILLGRVTYELFAGHWPNVPSGPDKPFADKLNAIPKVVFSRTLDRAPWGSYPDAKVVKTSASKEVAKLRGRALFPEQTASVNMKLLTTKSFDRGAVLLTYTAAPTERGL